MQQAIYHHIDIGDGRVITLETGRLAKQADGSVVVRLGDTMVLCTVVVSDEPKEGYDFFPLIVDYREKFSAGGKIPGGFIKREGRPSDKEILSSRLVDRAIRPLFPDGFRHDVQVLLNVVSADGENDADVLAGVGASAALMLSGAPFQGPIGEVRVGRIDGQFVINPTVSELQHSDFNLVVAGTKEAVVMVEGEMQEVSEADMVAALAFAHERIITLCEGQEAFLEAAGGPKPFTYTIVEMPEELVAKVEALAADKIAAHIRQPYEKKRFYEGLRAIRDEVVETLLCEEGPDGTKQCQETTSEGYTAAQIKEAFARLEKRLMREMILSEGRRIDGRGLEDIRPIWAEVGYLPRVHGSAIFTRGETQALASVTLGTSKDVQTIDQIFAQEDKRFYLHYNFPPFSTGEIKPLRGPGRREIGHGYLAERAIAPMLPSSDEFPYTIRVISDILESNGSSSMATVCAGTLGLMDAGVPIHKPVAGIAMGLIKEGEREAVLSDILGTEDHLGDMDFKVAGTRDGITACQMDIKIAGISEQTLARALDQARKGRLYILDKMAEVLPEPRPEISPYAPRLIQIIVDPEFIGAIIGPSGKVIQGIQRETNTQIDIEEKDGQAIVTIAAMNEADAEAAVERIRQIVAVPEVGEEYEGVVKAIQPFGAIVEIMPGKEGLLHVSELAHEYVERVEDYLKVGDVVRVKLIEIRDDGKLRLSRKPFLPEPTEEQKAAAAARAERGGGRRGSSSRGGGRRRDDGGRRGGSSHGRRR